MNKETKTWRRGIEWVEMIWHWTQSDPELKYQWVVANYWTIEDSLYENFIEELEENDMHELYNWFIENDRNSWFNWWLKKNTHLIWDLFSQVKQYDIL